MKRSNSYNYIPSHLDPNIRISTQNITLTGSLSKKVNDKNSAVWNGFTLKESGPKKEQRKSQMLWREYELSKRTIIPNTDIVDSFKPASNNLSKTVSGNISDMINRGFSEEKLGKLTKKVMLGEKFVIPNAMSADNHLISSGISNAYKKAHTGHLEMAEKRHKIYSAISKEKNVSQISTLPGGHRELDIKCTEKPEYFTSIYNLPSSGKYKEAKMIDVANPCLQESKRNH